MSELKGRDTADSCANFAAGIHPAAAIELLLLACGADMLRTNTSLQELALWNTNLRQEGASYILRALHSNGTLQRLDMGGNELGPEVSLLTIY